LFREDALEQIRSGRVSVVFRRWRQARVKAGTRLRLKELGLTESLEVGYRLSARGAAVLQA